MVRAIVRASLVAFVTLACSQALADDSPGQAKLDKAAETKLSAERVADLNEVIQLCKEAIKDGLDDANRKFADELLASTLTQRASLVCMELFERPVTPSRARKLVEMAVADLDETLKLDADQAEAQYLSGRLNAHLGQKEKALAALDAAVRLTANDPPARAKALLVRANLRAEAADRQADYDEAVKLTPKDPVTLRFRGMYHFAQSHFEDALADFNAAIALAPEDSDTYEARGLAQSMLEKYDEAMESFNKAIELEPESPMAHIHRARIRAIKGDNAAALADAEAALRLQPGSIQARLLHAALLSAGGKYDKALDDLNLLRNALPRNPEVLMQIAMLHQAAKQPAQAVAAYDAVIESDPGNANAYRGRADSNLSLGRQADAVADYDQALKLDPKNSGVLNNLAWVLATSPEDKLRDGKRAIELATKACEVTEFKQAHILSTLAASYAETGDFETAIKWSKEAVEAGPASLKGQLAKELESYEASRPWREASPPTDEPADEAPTPNSEDKPEAKCET